jgi:hypothetical protein
MRQQRAGSLPDQVLRRVEAQGRASSEQVVAGLVSAGSLLDPVIAAGQGIPAGRLLRWGAARPLRPLGPGLRPRPDPGARWAALPQRGWGRPFLLTGSLTRVRATPTPRGRCRSCASGCAGRATQPGWRRCRRPGRPTGRKEVGGAGRSLEHPGPLLAHLQAVYSSLEHSERGSTLLESPGSTDSLCPRCPSRAGPRSASGTASSSTSTRPASTASGSRCACASGRFWGGRVSTIGR